MGEHVTLREYLESKLDALAKALELAAENLKFRLDHLNEWRLQLKDERSIFATREELEALKKIVYMMLGGLFVLQILLKFLID